MVRALVFPGCGVPHSPLIAHRIPRSLASWLTGLMQHRMVLNSLPTTSCDVIHTRAGVIEPSGTHFFLTETLRHGDPSRSPIIQGDH